MFSTHTPSLTAICSLLLTTACTLPDDAAELGEDASFRSVTVSDGWGIHEDADFPEVNSCVDYWNDRCANLTPSQCSVAKNRYTCTQNSQGVSVSDNYGALAEATAWHGYSLGDPDSSTTTGNPGELCGELGGLEYETCLGLAEAAVLADKRSDELLAAFPAGGFGSLRVHEGAFVVESFAGGEQDLIYDAASALGWRAPVIEGELSLGEAGGAVLPPDTMISVRPNGTVAISCDIGFIDQQPQPRPQPLTGHAFNYSMSAPGANYNQQWTWVVGGWSRYAALWKAFVDQNVGSVDVLSAYVGSNHDILLGAEHPLNTHESLHFTGIWGTHYDPVGVWMSVDIDDSLTGLAYAAIVMHYWHSPVFFSGKWEPPLFLAPSGAWYQELALEQIDFYSPTHTSLHDACGISPTASATDALSQIQSCNFGGLSVTRGIVTAWLGDYSPMNSPALLHHATISGSDLHAAYAAGYHWGPSSPSGRVGELIFDPPPEADEEEIAAVLNLAEFVADEIRAQVPEEELFEGPVE